MNTDGATNQLWSSKQRGMVLVILLWVLAIVSLVTLSFSKSIRVEFNAARNNKDMVAAYYLAKAGMAESAFRLIRRQLAPAPPLTDAILRPPDDLDRGLVISEFPEGRVTTRIVDESGKISINFANDEMLRRLMAAIGIDKNNADIIVDSIFDWTDPDTLHRLSGAEDDYYQKLNPPYRAKNGPFDTIEELLLVRGVTQDIFYGVKEQNEMGQVIEKYGLINYLTVYSYSSQININAAPLPVLLSVPDLEPNAARLIYERRLEKPFVNLGELTQLLPVGLGRATTWLRAGMVGTSLSYSLQSEAELTGSQIKRILRCVIVIDQQDRVKYRTIYWNELTR
jgi:general secretion pathway protein K